MGLYADFLRFFAGFSDFIDDVFFQQVKVQLFSATCVESETAYLAFEFSFPGFVTVILGGSSSKLYNVITLFQFAGEFVDMIS